VCEPPRLLDLRHWRSLARRPDLTKALQAKLRMKPLRRGRSIFSRNVWRSLAEGAGALENPDKSGTNQLVCFAGATTMSYHPASGSGREMPQTMFLDTHQRAVGRGGR
jgi:hypothetical protein